MAGEASKWSSDKGIYSVAYEVNLPKDMYPGVSDAKHFQEANREGVLQLFPRDQHQAQGLIQIFFHPNGRGGMQNLGGGR